MHTLDLGEIEAIAAGSPEKWWYKPPDATDHRRIKAFVATLSTAALDQLYEMSKNSVYSSVDNRFYLLLCEVKALRDSRQAGLGTDSSH